MSIEYNIPNEIFFIVEEATEGGWVAHALGQSIFTEGETMEDLHQNIRDATVCHFEEGQMPKLIRLHFIKEELIAV